MFKQHLPYIIYSGINPYIPDCLIGIDGMKDYIFTIDRGDCYFADKVEHAQSLGASGVIICDSKIENLFTPWSPSDVDGNDNKAPVDDSYLKLV